MDTSFNNVSYLFQRYATYENETEIVLDYESRVEKRDTPVDLNLDYKKINEVNTLPVGEVVNLKGNDLITWLFMNF